MGAMGRLQFGCSSAKTPTANGWQVEAQEVCGGRPRYAFLCACEEGSFRPERRVESIDISIDRKEEDTSILPVQEFNRFEGAAFCGSRKGR